MTTSTLTRTIAALSFGLGFATITVRADPPGGGGLGQPDRDVIRDPYSALLANGGTMPGLPQNFSVVGPSLGLGFVPPPLLLGGGGGGGGGSGGFIGTLPTFSVGSPAILPASGGGTSTVGQSGGGTANNGGANSPFTAPGTSSNSSTSTPTVNVSSITVPTNVPEGGNAAALLALGLLATLSTRARLMRSKS
jgi:hypothetical protein